MTGPFDLERLGDGRYFSDQVEKAARRLRDQLADAKPGTIDRLRDDAWREISNWTEIVVREVGTAPGDSCSVAGYCNLQVSPAVVSIASGMAHRRRTFTLLHEIAHFLQQNDVMWADLALYKQKDFGRRLEEQVCDAFAAEILLGDGLTERVVADTAVSASTVQSLFDASQASRSACCVRTAQLLPAGGWVLLTDMEGVVQFAAASGDRGVPTRGTVQGNGHISLRAAQFGSARSEDAWISFRSGRRLNGLYADSVRDAGWRYVYTVITMEVPPWLPAYTQPRKFVQAPEWDCFVCSATAKTAPDSCSICKQPKCWRCAMCACGQRQTEKRCSKCFLVQGVGAFDGSSDVCRECS